MEILNQKRFLLIIPVLLAALFYVLNKTIYALKRKRAEELFDNYHKDRIIYFSKEVDFFGQKSAGRTQIRGNGSLILTPEKIHFLRWMPKKDIIIPLENVEKIERVNKFLGKKKKEDLLKVDFNNYETYTDSAAWSLDNIQAWEQVIQDNLDN